MGAQRPHFEYVCSVLLFGTEVAQESQLPVHPCTLAVAWSMLAREQGMAWVSAESNAKVPLKGIYNAGWKTTKTNIFCIESWLDENYFIWGLCLPHRWAMITNTW